MPNPFDQFDAKSTGNPFDRFDPPSRTNPARPRHPEFDGSGVPGYDPATGMVERRRGGLIDQAGAFSINALDSLPIVGPSFLNVTQDIAALAAAPFSDRSLTEIRDSISQASNQVRQDNPGSAFAGGVTGAVAGTVPMVMAAPAAFGAAGGGLLARSLASGVSGAALGGGDAAVRSGGDARAIGDGMKWGAGLGLVAPTAGRAIGAGVGKVANMFRSSPIAAQQSLARASGADAVDDIAARLQALGPDAMPMDLGPNLQRQAGALAATPGRGQQIVRNAIAGRQAAAGPRIASAMDDSLGQSVDTIALADDIISTAKQNAKPLYDAAYRKGVPFTTELETLLKRPTVARALTEAQRLAADDDTFNAATRGWFANVADDGSVTITRTPSVYELDMTKRALDDMHQAAKKSGSGNAARIIDQLRKKLLSIVDENVDEYPAARRAYGGPASVVDAIEEGQKAFAGSLTPSQLRTRLMRMGTAEREAYIQGARAEVAKAMGTARNDALAARSMFDKGWNREKLEILVGKPQAAKLLGTLDAEAAFTRSRDVVTGNSETAARLAAKQEIGAGAREPGLIRNALNMRFGDAVADVGDRALGSARTAARQRANEELARLLTSRDPKAITRAIHTVQAAQRRGDITAARATEIVQGMMLSGAQGRAPMEITVGARR